MWNKFDIKLLQFSRIWNEFEIYIIFLINLDLKYVISTQIYELKCTEMDRFELKWTELKKIDRIRSKWTELEKIDRSGPNVKRVGVFD